MGGWINKLNIIFDCLFNLEQIFSLNYTNYLRNVLKIWRNPRKVIFYTCCCNSILITRFRRKNRGLWYTNCRCENSKLIDKRILSAKVILISCLSMRDNKKKKKINTRRKNKRVLIRVYVVPLVITSSSVKELI